MTKVTSLFSLKLRFIRGEEVEFNKWRVTKVDERSNLFYAHLLIATCWPSEHPRRIRFNAIRPEDVNDTRQTLAAIIKMQQSLIQVREMAYEMDTRDRRFMGQA